MPHLEKKSKSKHVAIGVCLKEGRIGPYSNHFSILCLDDDVSFKSSELMENCIDDEQGPNILRFSSPHKQINIPRIRAKKC